MCGGVVRGRVTRVVRREGESGDRTGRRRPFTPVLLQRLEHGSLRRYASETVGVGDRIRGTLQRVH